MKILFTLKTIYMLSKYLLAKLQHHYDASLLSDEVQVFIFNSMSCTDTDKVAIFPYPVC